MYDYDDYLAEQEELWQNLVDNQTVLHIANERVKQRLNDLADSNKYLHDLLDKRDKEISQLKSSLKEFNNLEERHKKEMKEVQGIRDEESGKAYLRKQNPWGLTDGDTCYYVDYHYVKKQCETCGGTGELEATFQGDKKMKVQCPTCKGKSELSETVYEVVEGKVKFIGMVNDCDMGWYYKIVTHGGKYQGYYNPDQFKSEIFTTREQADVYFKEFLDKRKNNQ